MVEGKGVAQEQEVDYEFFKAGIDGRKEGQQATDKRPGESSLFNNNSLFLTILTFFASCSHDWWPFGGRGCGVHGEAVQEQAKGHEDLGLPHPHQDVRTDDCCRQVEFKYVLLFSSLTLKLERRSDI